MVQYISLCFGIFQCVTEYFMTFQYIPLFYSALQYFTV